MLPGLEGRSPRLTSLYDARTRPLPATRAALVQFHILSFEGPDGYSRAGGIASRVSGMADALAAEGFEVHLWFVGDPGLPGHERRGGVHLHRWCQWISHWHPVGVYDGEEGKRVDYAGSLPPFLVKDALLPWLQAGGHRAVVLAEEWQTADAVCHLDGLLRSAGIRHRVAVLWNANNLFGFGQVNWKRLGAGSTITTVSRYMRGRMWNAGVDPLVLPNGLPPEAFRVPEETVLAEYRRRVGDRLVLAKVARWDPDKRWLLAVDAVGELKRRGRRPLLIARGGLESHGAEVMARSAAAGLTVIERGLPRGGPGDLLRALDNLGQADVVSLTSPLVPEACRLLFRGADAVLANSGSEPFGLVGLETMAVGGIACTGGTGEDYAVPGWNALVLQTSDPGELGRSLDRLQTCPAEERVLRYNARRTARQYRWAEILRRHFLPTLEIGPVAPVSGRGAEEPAVEEAALSLLARRERRTARHHGEHVPRMPLTAATGLRV